MDPVSPLPVSAAAAVSVRAARPQDSHAIVALVRALAAHVGDERLAKVTPEALAEAGSGAHPLWRGVVAESAAGDVVGVCVYSVIFSTWVGSPGIYVIDLFVKKELRGSRLGRRLLAATAELARHQGARFMRLDVDARNRSAEQYYQRLGFTKLEGDSSFVIKLDRFDALADASD